MNLKEKLLELRKRIIPFCNELDNDILENHTIGNQEIYRLYYIDYHKIGENYGFNSKFSMTNWPFKPFMLPNGMTREEGFKVLSYLTDLIEKSEDIETCSLKSVKTLDEILNLNELGFIRVLEDDESKIINLFTVNGRVSLFKKSDLYSKYFEWYIENVSLEEVISIYQKYNIEFKDIQCLANLGSKEYSKVLIRK